MLFSGLEGGFWEEVVGLCFLGLELFDSLGRLGRSSVVFTLFVLHFFNLFCHQSLNQEHR